MALTGKIITQFEQLHGVSLDTASEMLADGESVPCLGEGIPGGASPIIGRGNPLPDKTVGPEAKHRQNQEIIRRW